MDDFDLFTKAASALETGQRIALVTVISTSGSTPGKVGYKMLVFAGYGETAGTVGGGPVEAAMKEEARKMLAEPKSRVYRFDLGATPEDEKGICGGSVELLIESFDKGKLPLFKELAAAADKDRGGLLISHISPGKPPRKLFVSDAGQIDANAGGMPVFIESVARAPAVVIFGAGHLSYYIAKYAKSVHFRVTVFDDRSEYANRERFPDADTIVVEDFGRVLDRIPIDGNSYIVIVTRGHRCDEAVLEQVVTTQARYIGMIGSKRKTRLILERLGQRGIPQVLLHRIYSPIGLSIGAVTPEEIALSIVSELVKIRRLGRGSEVRHMALSYST